MKRPKELSPLGSRIFDWLLDKSKKDSLKEIAGAVGVPHSTLLRNLKESSDPKLSVLEAVGRYLGKSLTEVVYGSKNELTTVVTLNTNKHQQDIAEWINEQEDGIDYWTVAKSEMASEYPEFKDWLKKRQGDGDSATPHERESVG